MTLLVTGTVRLPAENLDAARPHMAAMVAASRAEPGCLEYAYALDVLDPGLVRVHELWADRDALEAHFRTPHLAAWRDAWPALGIGDRDLVRYEVGEPERT